MYRLADAVNLYRLGMVLSVRGETVEAESVYRNSLAFWEAANVAHLRGFLLACLAQQELWKGKFDLAYELASEASTWFDKEKRANNAMTQHRLLGTIAMERGELRTAEEELHQALTLARGTERIEEELLSLEPLAKLRGRQGRPAEAREVLARMFQLGRQESYPLFYANAYNVLTSIERLEHRTREAIVAASEAYRLAWCDGPPYAYHWGIETAKQNLLEMGAPIPILPPFDASKFPSMPGATATP